MFLTLANIVLPVFLIIAVGALYAKRFKPDISWINKLNMDVFIPALIFSVLSSSDFQLVNYWHLVIGTSVVVVGSGLMLWPLVKPLKVSAKTFLPPMMFNNTGNMGIPLLLLAFGETALPAAITVFITVTLLHFTLGLYILNSNTKFSSLFKIPILVASVVGLLISHFNLQLPSALAMPVEMLGQISIPLMLFALGVRLLDVNFKDMKLGIVGAIACPVSGMLLAYLIAPFLTLPDQQWGILLVVAALPPAVLNFMLAEQYQQEPQRVASIVLAGNFASLVFIPLALWLALF
ncbi:MAG TPA: AEC family transporter [Marinospirillum sp.]|uniref:AEC family transporter n=1 Tax=Marinospirillum sp. TaxID=2183934 RepID=UPI002B48AE18|nr:AEC family transporter [Marinospirillum sp.]HKM16039.1 AEC family transporter [Marinospirillum sp.]